MTHIPLSYAYLPFVLAQEKLAEEAILLASPVYSAEVGWHGTNFHPDKTSVAIVSAEREELVALIDTIILLTERRTRRSVYVYVIGASENIAEDISIPRRPFAALSYLSSDAVTCTVETTP